MSIKIKEQQPIWQLEYKTGIVGKR